MDSEANSQSLSSGPKGLDCSQVLRKQKQRKKLWYTLHTDLLNYKGVTTHSYSVTLAFDCWCAAGSLLLMIEFFLPHSRALLPSFHTNCPERSHFAQKGPLFARNTTLNHCSVLSHHTPLVRTQNTPKPTLKPPFPGLNLKSGKINYSLGNFDPNWAKCLKSGQKWAKKFIHVLLVSVCCWL